MPLSAKHPTAAIREPFALSSRTRLALALSWLRERHLPTEVVGVLNSHAFARAQHVTSRSSLGGD
jgi:hypothetical protein